MDIRVSGHQVETGTALQEHASDRLVGIVEKHFDRAISSHVTFGKGPAGGFTCDIIAMAEDESAYTILSAYEPVQEVVSDAPPVIAETSVDVPTATVADAVMMLDLRDTPALFFKNAGTERHNMVYRRSDGSIGWVEPR